MKEPGLFASRQKSAALLFAPIIIVWLLLAVQPVTASKTLLVFDFNRDCVADTLTGDIIADTVLPRQIIWGNHSTCPLPGDPYHDSLRHFRTWLKLPALSNIKVLPTAGNVNSAQDTTADLTLFIQGQVSDGQGGYLDSALALVLFGQHGLDTLDTLDLCLVTSSSLLAPFTAILLSSSNLTNPVDLWAGKTSARLTGITLPSAKEGVSRPQTPSSGPLSASLSPTPSRNFAILTVEGLRDSETDVHILDTRGRRVHNLKIPGGKFVEYRIDLRTLAAGQYSLLIDPSGLQPLHLPLIIIR